MKKHLLIVTSLFLLAFVVVGCKQPQTTETNKEGSEQVIVYKKMYTISFDANGGTGTMDDIEVAYGEKVTLSGNSFIAPVEKVFKGWSLYKNSTKIDYADKAEIEIKKNLILYAVWESNYSYKIDSTKPSSIKLIGITGTETDYPVYLASKVNDKGVETVINDVPYLSFTTVYETLFKNQLGNDYDLKANVSFDEYGMMLKRNDQYLFLDAKENFIHYTDKDVFFKIPGSKALISFGEEDVYIKSTNLSTYRTGTSTSVFLSDYDIHMIMEKDEKGNCKEIYLPATTWVDAVLPIFSGFYVYNGKDLFCTSNFTMKDFYKNGVAENTKRSEDLQWFNYNELCLNLDYNYGLKEIHKINSFNEFFFDSNLIYDFIPALENEEDPRRPVDGLCRLQTQYFADYHSSVIGFSAYAGEDYKPANITHSTIYSRDQEYSEMYSRARNDANLDLHVHTDENGRKYIFDINLCGDTLVITFDVFKTDYISYQGVIENIKAKCEEKGYTEPYYTYPEFWTDTIMLIHCADCYVKNDNNIKNVVFDLSLNGGGSVDSAIFLLSWVLGNPTLNIESTITGSQSSTNYIADINFDGVFDDYKTPLVNQRNVYCLISNNSFSCGNLVPFAMKDSKKVNLIGQKTGGGSCVVGRCVTPDGNIMNISGIYKICYVKNGSWYDVDQGVDPDFALKDPSKFYNRTALVNYINNTIDFN